MGRRDGLMPYDDGMRSALASIAVALATFAIAASCGGGPFAEEGADASAADGEAEAAPVDAGGGGPVPKGSRTLGVAVAIDGVALSDELRVIREAGARATNVSFAWDDVERTDDAGTPYLFHPGIHLVSLVVASSGTDAALALDAVDRRGPRLPSDLASRPLDDPEVASRYQAATDYVLSQVPDLDATAYLVASDVDVALGADAARHAAFATFFGRVAAHARGARPGLRVGFVVTSDGLKKSRALLDASLAAADVVCVSHVGALPGDLDAIVAAAPPDKPILVHAIGHPSDPDERAQTAFVRDVFASWDRHADRIGALTFFELDDAPRSATTFGLRRYADGRAKRAFGVLSAEARARGF